MFVSHFLLKGSAGGNDEHAVVLWQRWRYWWLVPLWFHLVRRRWSAHLCAASSAHVSSYVELNQGFSFQLARHAVSWVLRNSQQIQPQSIIPRGSIHVFSYMIWSDQSFERPTKKYWKCKNVRYCSSLLLMWLLPDVKVYVSVNDRVYVMFMSTCVVL